MKFQDRETRDRRSSGAPSVQGVTQQPAGHGVCLSLETIKRLTGCKPERIESVSVVTPTVDPEASTLERASDSVKRQITGRKVRHIIVADEQRRGPGWARNEGIQGSTDPWVAFLDADDELYPHHVEALTSAAEACEALGAPADVVWSRCELWTPRASVPPEVPDWYGRHSNVEAAERYNDLRKTNWIPVTTLVRASALAAVGGFPELAKDMPAGRHEDWGLWVRLLDAGARFVHIPRTTWVYYRMPDGRNSTG